MNAKVCISEFKDPQNAWKEDFIVYNAGVDLEEEVNGQELYLPSEVLGGLTAKHPALSPFPFTKSPVQLTTKFSIPIHT